MKSLSQIKLTSLSEEWRNTNVSFRLKSLEKPWKLFATKKDKKQGRKRLHSRIPRNNRWEFQKFHITVCRIHLKAQAGWSEILSTLKLRVHRQLQRTGITSRIKENRRQVIKIMITYSKQGLNQWLVVCKPLLLQRKFKSRHSQTENMDPSIILWWLVLVWQVWIALWLVVTRDFLLWSKEDKE